MAEEAEKLKKMIELCKNQLKFAYCPYSNFAVSSVLETEDGTLITGVNVENVSYGVGICAERTAAVKAISEGHRKFKRCLVTTNSELFIGPCGACRQFLAEFGMDCEVVLVNKLLEHRVYSLKELLPLTFDQNALNSGQKKQ